MAIKGGFWIHVTCDKCGRVQEFTRADKDKAIQAAKAAGWAMERRKDGTGGEICADCYVPIIAMADLRSERLAKRAQGKVR